MLFQSFFNFEFEVLGMKIYPENPVRWSVLGQKLKYWKTFISQGLKRMSIFYFINLHVSVQTATNLLRCSCNLFYLFIEFKHFARFYFWSFSLWQPIGQWFYQFCPAVFETWFLFAFLSFAMKAPNNIEIIYITYNIIIWHINIL